MSQNNPNNSRHLNFWQRLAEPIPSITDSGKRRQASLVSGLALALAAATSAGTLANIFALHFYGLAAFLGIAAVAFLITYGLSRSKYSQAARILLLAIIIFLSWGDVFTQNDFSSGGLLGVLVFNILVILVASYLVSLRTTVFIAVANFIYILSLPLWIPAVQIGNLTMSALYNAIVSALILVLAQNRDQTEKERVAELAGINQTLQTNNEVLNARTQDLDARTRELTLAAEVGRSVSQVRALDVMLRDAAETIRSRFNLYYVQVYLTNESQRILRLQSGTGTVGVELIARGHSLALDTNSINGRAAVEKQAVVIGSTVNNPAFRTNPLLPETRSEMAVPLLAGDKVVGVLDMQSSQPGALSEDMLPAFEALAGQFAIAIQNANLLAETELARQEVEKQARLQARTNWTNYMDAIHTPEQIGFAFDGNAVTPLAETASQVPASDNAITAPIAVTGQALGSLVVELAAENQTPQKAELVQSIARQVSQQIENLRLLDSAERYRQEAEEATRRLTRGGWKTLVESKAGQFNYMYDLQEVKPYDQELAGQTTGLFISTPVKVHDETIGSLAIQGLESGDTASVNLVNAVAARLGEHIESLRLYDQTQSALTQSNRLFEASSRLTQAKDLTELTKTAISLLDIPEINRGLLITFNYGPDQNVESFDVIASWWNGTGHPATPAGTHYSRDVVQVMPLFISATPIFSDDTHVDPRIDPTTMQVVKQLNLRSMAVLPLHSGATQLGALIIEAEETHIFNHEEIRLFSAMAPQIATVVENRRQYERAQRQADRETMLNTISQKIQSATSVEAVLQIAARELGRALGAPLTIAQLGMKDRK